ncbi:hypothetical protein ASG22_18520 [Chryseobacterium sp. Leaf405]|uniref:DUF1294 domain-containing protein n=1 Tax=Chryseobacterium sp. Leaf405 TaxID=1736367 RepID=UPI0006F55BFE|nr:DUF1294 domain-containing protein [Chryseobacterium sp. Leaf405]KQT31540.1 hypothetical protein ASG22_18520 [Chryseobacterium sp. Leaf405]
MIVVIVILNILSFGIFGYDKFLAKKHRRRISENMLLICTFFAGTIGAFVGMIIFRHKISKKSFLLKFGLVVSIQVILMYFLKNILKMIN